MPCWLARWCSPLAIQSSVWRWMCMCALVLCRICVVFVCVRVLRILNCMSYVVYCVLQVSCALRVLCRVSCLVDYVSALVCIDMRLHHSGYAYAFYALNVLH